MTDWRQARYLVLDTETTGLDPAVDRIVELAASLVDIPAGTITPVFDERVNPGRPIPPEASAIHHLRDRDVAHAAPWEEVWARFRATVPAHDALLAHNAPFDHAFCAPESPAWLDSLRAARHLWPEAPRHTNQVLRYWLDLEVDAPHPHRAADDTQVTGAIWQRLVATLAVRPDAPAPSLEALAAWIAAPLDLTTVPFGKYKGQPFTVLPPDYIRWGLANIEDPDVVNQLRKVQESRRPAAARRLL